MERPPGPPRSSLKRAANWSRNINHAFFQRELSCHSPTWHDTPHGPDAAVFLLRRPPSIFLPGASFTEMLSAFVFSRRTAKRSASNSGWGKLSSEVLFCPSGQLGVGNEGDGLENALKNMESRESRLSLGARESDKVSGFDFLPSLWSGR